MIQEKAAQLIDEFSMFDDWMDKYNYLIELGKSLPSIDEKYKTDENIIKGCQSRVWLHASFDGDKVSFTGDSDAIITKGIAALLIRVFNEETPAEILSADLGFVDQLGLKEHLSPTRSNGLVSMIKQIRFYALAFQAKA
ncbi:MAG: Fe-S metabolism protein SufE [Marinilabiliales bacterium]|mgnify:CR=1 FL=1|nr:MAG: Fe-S metabolism protein SufE [Marinilabiliales bacterium]